jgi:hypothetical protein
MSSEAVRLLYNLIQYSQNPSWAKEHLLVDECSRLNFPAGGKLITEKKEDYVFSPLRRLELSEQFAKKPPDFVSLEERFSPSKVPPIRNCREVPFPLRVCPGRKG